MVHSQHHRTQHHHTQHHRTLRILLLAMHKRFRAQIRELLLCSALPEVLHSLAPGLVADEWQAAEREVVRAERAGVRTVALFEEEYPAVLRHIPDPPLVLFVRGVLRPGRRAGLIGARKASGIGMKLTFETARGLAASGIQVVSGLAYGIDAAAHRGALAGAGEAGNPGIAVLGSGLGEIYPPEHAALAEEIVERGGAVVSEYPLATAPHPGRFPERNRIVSGLSDAVIVFEAAFRSGALITASLAAEQGREVFAVPGTPGAKQSEGPNKLLKGGASVFTELEDLAFVFPQLAKQKKVKRGRTERCGAPLDPFQRSVLRALHPQIAREFDELVDALAAPPVKLTQVLSELELLGLVCVSGIGGFVRKSDC